MSKAYGLPGLRIGWLATRDRALLARLETRKHYTSICNAAPSELIATAALRRGPELRARNRAIIDANLPVFDAFFAGWEDRFAWEHPQAGCVCFPRYLGADGVDAFCHDLVEQAGVVLLPVLDLRLGLGDVPPDRFRIGVGRRDPEPALAALDAWLQRAPRTLDSASCRRIATSSPTSSACGARWTSCSATCSAPADAAGTPAAPSRPRSTCTTPATRRARWCAPSSPASARRSSSSRSAAAS